jgi:hypothetical protein
MHKQAMKRLSDEVQRLKHARDNLPEVAMLLNYQSSISGFFIFLLSF